MPSIQNLPYEERLGQLNFPSLMHRKRRGDMVQTNKILTEKINFDKHVFFKISRSATRGHNYKLHKQHANKLDSRVFEKNCKRLEWFILPSS